MRLLSLPVLVLAAACASAPPPKPPPPLPELGPVELAGSQGLTDFKLSLQTSLKPAEAAHLMGARVELVVDGNVVKTTEVALDKALPAGEATPVELSESGKYVGSAEELQAMNAQGGSLKAALRGEFTVRQGEVLQKVEFARARDLRVPRLPKVKAKDAEGGKHADDEVQVVLYFQVENPNPFPLNLNKLTYTATMLGKQMAERTEGGEKISASSTDTFEVRFPFDTATWGKDVKAKIKAGTLPWTLAGKLEGDLFEVPFELSGTLRLSSK
jgi:LEA14-like dessication related protein